MRASFSLRRIAASVCLVLVATLALNTAPAAAHHGGAHILKLYSITCWAQNDLSGDDEPYLKLNGSRIWENPDAVESLVCQTALDYASRGIRINAVAPGLVDGSGLPNASSGYPIGRTLSPQEVANAVFFLASPEASGITGALLPVDGGLSIASPAAFTRPDLMDRLARLRDAVTDL